MAISESQTGRIVLVDDDEAMREMVGDYLSRLGFSVKAFESGHLAFEWMLNEKNESRIEELDLIISDVQMPEMDGLELVERVKKLDRDLPIILVTAFGSIESAIEATRIGAFDYVLKPFKLSEIEIRASKAVQLRRLKRENLSLRQEVSKNFSYLDMIGKSRAMRMVFDSLERVAQATAHVLVTGESGTGKEIVARAIHERGPRSSKPFVAINCTAIPATLMESELFGHARGSFTGAIARKKGLFEEADGGTIFLDEIGDLDLSLQAKLLRVAQEKSIRSVGDTDSKQLDVRIISATHKDLAKAVKEGNFREDLYYRISVIPISLPPLRHRRDDIPLLANHFLRKFSAANGSKVRGITPSAMERLVMAKWDGNVRELENLIERMVVLAKGDMIDVVDLPMVGKQSLEDFYGAAVEDLPGLETLEKRYIQYVLEKVGGHKEKASQILGINRRTLYRKERDYGLISEDSPEPAEA